MNRRIIPIRRARSPAETAIKEDLSADAVRHRIVRELNASLYQLSHQPPAVDMPMISSEETPHIDEHNRLRDMEESQLTRAIESLADTHLTLWRRAADAPSASAENVDDDLQLPVGDELRSNRIPFKLRNWCQRVDRERAENAALLAALRARKAELREDRREVNRMISMIVKIFDESRPTALSTVPAADRLTAQPGPLKRMKRSAVSGQ